MENFGSEPPVSGRSPGPHLDVEAAKRPGVPNVCHWELPPPQGQSHHVTSLKNEAENDLQF